MLQSVTFNWKMYKENIYSGYQWYFQTQYLTQISKDSGVRSENFGDTNVCCRESDLNTDARNSINWSLTKDPKRCDEFKKDGYK